MDETYTAKEFVKEIAVWQQEGFTDSNLRKSLEQYIQPDLLAGKTLQWVIESEEICFVNMFCKTRG